MVVTAYYNHRIKASRAVLYKFILVCSRSCAGLNTVEKETHLTIILVEILVWNMCQSFLKIKSTYSKKLGAILQHLIPQI